MRRSSGRWRLLVAAGPAIVSAQAPKDAIVVSDADIKAVLKMAADTKRTIPDNTLRVVDMGAYQLGVAVVAPRPIGVGAAASRGGPAAAPAANRSRRVADAVWRDRPERHLPRQHG